MMANAASTVRFGGMAVMSWETPTNVVRLAFNTISKGPSRYHASSQHRSRSVQSNHSFGPSQDVGFSSSSSSSFSSFSSSSTSSSSSSTYSPPLLTSRHCSQPTLKPHQQFSPSSMSIYYSPTIVTLHHSPTSTSLHNSLPLASLHNSPPLASLHHSPPFYHSPPFRNFSTSASDFDHYRTLGIRRGATQKEIKEAFYLLSLLFHPDRQPKKTPQNKNRGNLLNRRYSLDEYQDISLAYSVLSDPEKREAYDLRRKKALTSFDKWRDDWEEWRHRMYHRRRLARQRRVEKVGGGGGEELSEEDLELERERQNRALDPHGMELVMGSRRNGFRIFLVVGMFFAYGFYDSVMNGNILKK